MRSYIHDTKKHYVAPIKPEAIYIKWLKLTVSPMSISDDLPHDPLCNKVNIKNTTHGLNSCEKKIRPVSYAEFLPQRIKLKSSKSLSVN